MARANFSDQEVTNRWALVTLLRLVYAGKCLPILRIGSHVKCHLTLTCYNQNAYTGEQYMFRSSRLTGLRGPAMPWFITGLRHTIGRLFGPHSPRTTIGSGPVGVSQRGNESGITERLDYHPRPRAEVRDLMNKLKSGELSSAALDEMDRAAEATIDAALHASLKSDPALIAQIDAWVQRSPQREAALSEEGRLFYENVARELVSPRGGKARMTEDEGAKR
jgi:hypothetical protein